MQVYLAIAFIYVELGSVDFVSVFLLSNLSISDYSVLGFDISFLL